MPITDPGLTGAVVRPGTEARLTDEGWHVPMNITMPPELFEQYRQGYRCPRCHSVQSEAFPEECEMVWRDTGQRCGFKIKDKLNDWLEFEFRGEESLWPENREDAINDDREREDWTARKGIWLPGGDD
jgi:hypothetical protein